MAFDDADMAATLDELLALPRAQQLEYLQGLLIGQQYNALLEAAATMHGAAANEEVDDTWREANLAGSQLLFSYMEVLADGDQVPDTDRFWRN